MHQAARRRKCGKFIGTTGDAGRSIIPHLYVNKACYEVLAWQDSRSSLITSMKGIAIRLYEDSRFWQGSDDSIFCPYIIIAEPKNTKILGLSQNS